MEMRINSGGYKPNCSKNKLPVFCQKTTQWINTKEVFFTAFESQRDSAMLLQSIKINFKKNLILKLHFMVPNLGNVNHLKKK